MKILKSYYKTPSFLTGRCIVSLAILGLISCSDRNGKSLSEATNDPAGIYREYLYNIRCQKDSSFQGFSWCCCIFISSEAPSSLYLSLPFLVFGLKSNILALLFAYLACLGHVFYNKSAAIGCCTFAIISICHIRPSRTPSSFFRPPAPYLTAQSKLCRHSIRIPMPFRRRRLVPERLSL